MGLWGRVAVIAAWILALSAFAWAASARWDISTPFAHISITYELNAEIVPSKDAVSPGESIDVRVVPRSSRLVVDLSFSGDVPYVGGQSVSLPIDVELGREYSGEFDVTFGVKLRVFGSVDAAAKLRAEGADPPEVSGELPLRATFTTQGAATFVATLYARPRVGVELLVFGTPVFRHEQPLEERELSPQIRRTVRLKEAPPPQPAAAGAAQAGAPQLPQFLPFNTLFYTMLALAIVLAASVFAARLLLSRRPPPQATETARRGWPAPSPRPLAYLITHDGRYIPVYSNDRVFGRGDFSFLPPDLAQYISARHFRIFYWGGQWYIEDLGSKNGTLVDGADIRGKGPTPLRHGAVITVASVVSLAFYPLQ